MSEVKLTPEASLRFLENLQIVFLRLNSSISFLLLEKYCYCVVLFETSFSALFVSFLLFQFPRLFNSFVNHFGLNHMLNA